MFDYIARLVITINFWLAGKLDNLFGFVESEAIFYII